MKNMLSSAVLFVIISFAVAVGAACAPLMRSFLERTLGYQFDKRLEEFRYGVRVREQAARVAEYLALHMRLSETDSKEAFNRINQIGWELALYLPADIYLHVRDAVAKPSETRNNLTALVAVRRHLLGRKAGELRADDIAFHHPDAAKVKKMS